MNILILNHRYMGDVLMSTPAIEQLKIIYPKSHIYCYTSKIGERSLEGNECIAGIITEEQDLFEILSDKKLHLAILFKADLKHALLIKKLKPKKSIGIAKEGTGLLLNHSVPYKKNRHWIHLMLDCVNQLKTQSKLPASDKMCYYPQQFTDVKPKGSYCVFISSSTREEKNWPEENFIRLGQSFLSKNIFNKVVLLGGKDALDKNLRIASAIGPDCIDLTNQLSLPESADILKSSELVLTNDTGPMHLADAVRAKNIIALFGFSRFEHTGLLPGTGRVQLSRYKKALFPKKINAKSIYKISVEEVYQAYLRLL